jgi:DNA-binding GntR family transcriptional regulator
VPRYREALAPAGRVSTHGGVGAKPALFRGTVQIDHGLICLGQRRPGPAAEQVADLSINRRYRSGDPSALVLRASEGLVVAAKRGYMVREHTRDEIREIYEVRAALEEMAARLAAQRANDEQIGVIEAIGAHRRSVAGDLRSDIEDARTLVVRLNDEFHDAIMRGTGNLRLADINQRNSEHFFSHEIGKLYSSDEAAMAVKGHARIMAALKRRDPDAAGAAARGHVLEALEVTLSKLR